MSGAMPAVHQVRALNILGLKNEVLEHKFSSDQKIGLSYPKNVQNIAYLALICKI